MTKKITREKDVIQDNQLDEFINKVVDLKNERESNTHIIKINRVNKNHNKIQKTSK